MLLKLAIKKILEQPHVHKWSIQGMGMLRLYLSKQVRLHIWHPEFAVANVSTIHTHPWDFHSVIVCGQLTNMKYKDVTGQQFRGPVAPVHCGTIRCGVGGGLVGSGIDEERQLMPLPHQVLREGQNYTELAEEIHETVALAGTVTIVERMFKPDEDHAKVYWPAGTNWVSAEPREANVSEVRAFTETALSRWFS